MNRDRQGSGGCQHESREPVIWGDYVIGDRCEECGKEWGQHPERVVA